MALVLYCRKCSDWYATSGTVPPICPTCDQETTWTTTPVAMPKKPYALNYNDRQFLRSIRVKAEEKS